MMALTLIDRLRSLCQHVCTVAAMERRIDPTLTDILNESLDANHGGQHWRARWILLAGMLAVLKVLTLVTLDRGAEIVLRPDAETRSALLRLAAIFAVVVTMTAVVLAWIPLNTAPGARPSDARDLVYLIPAALPLAIPVGLMMAVGLARKASPAGPLAVWIIMAGLACSIASFVTLAQWAPASNQFYRVKAVGYEIPKGERELTLAELHTRIEQIRAFDPAAPARRLSFAYHTRWALSVTPLFVAVFALVITRRRRSPMMNGALAVVSSGAFLFVLMSTSYVGFNGSVSPVVAAWWPNLAFLGVAAIAMLWPRRVRDSVTQSGT